MDSLEMRRLVEALDAQQLGVGDDDRADYSGDLIDELDQHFSRVPLSDADAMNSKLVPRVRRLLFAERDLPEGSKVAVRLNLKGGMVHKDGRSFFLQTVHQRTPRGKPLGYDFAVTVRHGLLFVDQRARADIAERLTPKYPMAAVIGALHHGPANLTGIELRFNPMSSHLFTRVDNGLAVKLAEEVTVFNTRAYARGHMEYWRSDEAPMPLRDIPSDVKFIDK